MRLLVSVRSAEEAEAALAGGASIIDVKEPAHGPLGRAPDPTLSAIVEIVRGRVPVSAAGGELLDEEASRPFPAGLRFVKWGLAGAVGMDWQRAFRRRAGQLQGSEPVVVAYADSEPAAAPSVHEVVDFVCRLDQPGAARILLVDTFVKPTPFAVTAGRTLLDWLPVAEVTALCQRCHQEGVRVALAGSLGEDEVHRLLPAAPDWFAVRGAACRGRDRHQAVSADRVRALVRLLGVPGAV